MILPNGRWLFFSLMYEHRGPGAEAASVDANGVYHATGRRIRSLPITIDKLL